MARRMRTARRRKMWSSLLGLNDTALDLSVTQYGSGGLTFPESGLTVMRVMGSLDLSFNQVDDAIAAGDAVAGAVGLAVIPADQFAAGVTGLPDPAEEPEYPWLLWKDFQMTAEQAETAAMFIDVGGGHRHWEFDSRVRRVVKARETLVWIAQFTSITGSPFVRYQMAQNRVLLALP